MNIKINDTDYILPKEEELILLRQFRDMGLVEYGKLDIKWRIAVKPFARELLKKWEIETAKKFGKEQASVFRPEKSSDPVVHLTNILTGMLQEFLKNVTISFNLNDNITSHFSISFGSESQGGRQVVTDGNKR